MKVSAKKSDGSTIEFVFEDKGVMSHEVLSTLGMHPDRLPRDWKPTFVTMFVIEGKTSWSECLVSDCESDPEKRYQVDGDALRSHGIDPGSVEMIGPSA